MDSFKLIFNNSVVHNGQAMEAVDLDIFTIGSSYHNTIQIKNHGICNFHILIHRYEGRYWLKTNNHFKGGDIDGTYVLRGSRLYCFRNRQVKREGVWKDMVVVDNLQLEPGDIIIIGQFDGMITPERINEIPHLRFYNQGGTFYLTSNKLVLIRNGQRLKDNIFILSEHSIGTLDNNDIILFNDDARFIVNNFHAKVFFIYNGFTFDYYLVDLGSKNGTQLFRYPYKSGKKIKKNKPEKLVSRHKIWFGTDKITAEFVLP